MVSSKATMAVVSALATLTSAAALAQTSAPYTNTTSSSSGATPDQSSPDSGEAQQHAYQCGCQSRKQQLEGMGATAFDMAVAFQETGGDLSASKYAPGDGKDGAAANFGLFKNNWYMIQQACSYLGSDENSVANILNTDDAKAIQCQHDQISHFGLDDWYYGQRCGESGLQKTANSVTHTAEYKNGVEATLGYITQHLQDDMATWVEVPAVSGTDCN